MNAKDALNNQYPPAEVIALALVDIATSLARIGDALERITDTDADTDADTYQAVAQTIAALADARRYQS